MSSDIQQRKLGTLVFRTVFTAIREISVVICFGNKHEGSIPFNPLPLMNNLSEGVAVNELAPVRLVGSRTQGVSIIMCQQAERPELRIVYRDVSCFAFGHVLLEHRMKTFIRSDARTRQPLVWPGQQRLDAAF
jgi:hypothetical protein